MNAFCFSLKKSLASLFLTCSASSIAFSQAVVINELAIKPGADATSATIQSLKNCTTTTDGHEYIELYNTTDCPIDISCYIIMTDSWDGARDGSFRFPSGTIIPAKGFVSIGGPNTAATFNLALYCGNNHMVTANTRWYLENGDAWCALYNASGGFEDGVFWTANAGESAKWPSDTDLDDSPPYVPTATASSCASVSSPLSRPGATVGTGAAQIEYGGVNPPLGQVIERTTDGGFTWAAGAGTLNATNNVAAAVGSCALPLELSRFQAVLYKQNLGLLKWTTLAELNNDYFLVERSEDGTDFYEIGRVEGAGTSISAHYYHFLDENPIENRAFYRLKQVDTDGSYAYSETRMLDLNSKENNLLLYPNPAQQHCQVQFFAATEGRAPYAIFDALGRCVFEGEFETQKGENQLDLPVEKLSSGQYLLSILLDGEKQKIKFSKQ